MLASHWVLDLITHRPDLPLAPGVDKFFGFGLWNSVAITAALEVGMFLIAVRIYSNFTRCDTKAGSVSFWSLVLVLLGIQVSSYTGAPPPSAQVVAWVGLAAALLFVPWAMWIERTRRVPGMRPRN